MARRRSFVSAFAQMQREAARASAVQLRAEAAARKEADRAHAAYLAARAADEKERKRLYAESRAAAVAAAISDLDAKVAALESLLADALRAGGPITFSALKRPPGIPEWRHGYLEQPEPAPLPETFMPPAPAGLSKVFGGSRHQQAVAAGQAAYAQAAQEHRQREQQRLAALSRARADWQAAADAEFFEAFPTDGLLRGLA